MLGMEKNYLDINSNFLAIEEEYSNYKDSEIVIYSVPLEKTVSYGGGTIEGPKAIIEASHYVEFYDEETDKELCFDKKICTLAPNDISDKDIVTTLSDAEIDITSLLDDKKFVVTLGGEHSLSYAPVKAHADKYKDLTVLQIDAHSDLRREYEGSIYSHACVMRRIAEAGISITQLGIRAQCAAEAEFIRDYNINTFYMRSIRSGKIANWQEKLIDTLSEKVYLTIDVDGFDPSVFPGTGTPEPGGLMWDETLNLLKEIAKTNNIVGFDVVETAPREGETISEFNAAKLIYKLLNYTFY